MINDKYGQVSWVSTFSNSYGYPIGTRQNFIHSLSGNPINPTTKAKPNPNTNYSTIY